MFRRAAASLASAGGGGGANNSTDNHPLLPNSSSSNAISNVISGISNNSNKEGEGDDLGYVDDMEKEYSDEYDDEGGDAGGGCYDEDDDFGGEDDDNGIEMLQLKIKSFRDAEVRIPASATVAQAKLAVVSAMGGAARNRYLRLISKGRLLMPETAILKDFPNLKSGDYVHAVFAPPGHRGGVQARLQQLASASGSGSSRGGGGGGNDTNLLSGGGSPSSNSGRGLAGISRRALRGAGVNATGLAVRATTNPQHDSSSSSSSSYDSSYEDDEFDEEDVLVAGGGGAADEDNGISNNDNNLMALEEGRGSAAGRRQTRGGVSTGAGRQRSGGSLQQHSHRQRRGGRERLGFDRLRNPPLNMRRSDVRVIRACFSGHVDRWIRQNPERAQQIAGDETDLMRRRYRHEEAWMSTQGPASEFRLNLAGTVAEAGSGGLLWNAGGGRGSAAAWNAADAQQQGPWRTTAGGAGSSNNAAGVSTSVGTDRDFMWGFMLGFFVGFLMLVWVWMPTVPHKQKLGILTGISFQLALSMLKGNGDDEDGDDSLLD